MEAQANDIAHDKIATMDDKASADPIVFSPNTTASSFHAIGLASKLCGLENVSIVKAANELIDGDYIHPCKGHDIHEVLDRTYFVASATISPRSVPEVPEIMRLCNDFNVPVWPFSAGRNTGCGGATPRVPGSVCLDLGRHIYRILDGNTEDCTALVEPGVTFLIRMSNKRNVI